MRPLGLRPLHSLAVPLVFAMGIADVPVPAHAAARSGTAGDAQEEPADDARRTRGLALYDDGTAKYDAGDYRGAIEAFKASLDLIGEPQLLYNLGMCFDRLDELDSALEYFQRYRAVAPEAEYEQVDRKIDSIRKRQQAAREPAATIESDDASTGGASSPPRDVEPKSSRTPKVMSPAAWGLLGSSVALLATGGALAIVASRRNSAGADACQEAQGRRLCTGDGADQLRSGGKLGMAAIVVLSVGGALAVAAIAVIATNAGRRRAAGAQARVAPSLGGFTARF